MPARWMSLWGLITPPEGTAPPKLWPWLVGAGALILLAVAFIWFRFGWDIEELTTEFLVLTSFVILIGLALLKVRKEKDYADPRSNVEAGDRGQPDVLRPARQNDPDTGEEDV